MQERGTGSLPPGGGTGGREVDAVVEPDPVAVADEPRDTLAAEPDPLALRGRDAAVLRPGVVERGRERGIHPVMVPAPASRRPGRVRPLWITAAADEEGEPSAPCEGPQGSPWRSRPWPRPRPRAPGWGYSAREFSPVTR